jgi:hypothetical protein
MSTRCKVCLNEAARKCTDCGELFCDLHIRLAGQTGGMAGQGSSIGYFCDECWEKRFKRRKTWSVVMIGIALVLLGLNLLGVFVIRRGLNIRPEAWLAGAPIVMILILVVMIAAGLIVVAKRRNRP